MRLLVTGGAGFIGSALIRQLLAEEPSAVVINADKLTYAGNPECLESVSNSPQYYFERVDICDAGAIRQLFDRYEPDAVIHLIHFVQDRPVHDRRYAIDPTRVTEELGWAPLENFASALRKTVQWYLTNLLWCERVRDGSCRGERLGVMK